ncbi:MAG: hypothetical protein PHE06_12850 [Lachnospiraceae bacterium]|nr:hypothetical protein [Lachnospiraceae bacterium]
MRLKCSRVEEYYHRKRIPQKDKEGGTYDTYGSAASFEAEIWPASGKIQAEIYGERLKYIQNIRISGIYTVQVDEKGIAHYILASGVDIVESDGVCLYTGKEGKPDYRIVSIRPHRFLRLEVEKL